VLITPDRQSAGFFLPWDQPELREGPEGIHELLAGVARRDVMLFQHGDVLIVAAEAPPWRSITSRTGWPVKP
jgi:hypothetical protein